MRTRLVLVVLALTLLAPRVHAQASVEERFDQLQRALEAQRTESERQQRQLEAQAAELAELRKQVAESGAEEVAELKQEVQKAKLAAQEAPKVSLVAGRPTITSADGRSSISLRSVVQLDAARYDQDAAGPLDEDFRRGSVGAPPNREITSARDLSDGAYFRRARLGVEGIIAEDFGFRFMAEFGGSGTEGPARINDAWINYTGFAPFTVRSAPSRPRPISTTQRARRSCCSPSARRRPSCRARWAAPTGVSASRCAATGSAG